MLYYASLADPEAPVGQWLECRGHCVCADESSSWWKEHCVLWEPRPGARRRQNVGILVDGCRDVQQHVNNVRAVNCYRSRHCTAQDDQIHYTHARRWRLPQLHRWVDLSFSASKIKHQYLRCFCLQCFDTVGWASDLFSLPDLSGGRHIGCLPYFDTLCGPSANLECRSETRCMRLAENAGPKKSPKIGHLGTIAQLCRAISSQLRHISTIGKNLLSSNMSSTCPHNMVNFGPLAAEIGPGVWGTPANFNGFHVLAALLRGTVVVGVSPTLRHWTEGATYIWQGGHHVGHWPTFLVVFILCCCTFLLIGECVLLLV